jgi:DNA-binding NarL/FixJ family response regulator
MSGRTKGVIDDLTARQVEIMTMTSGGLLLKEIAARLGISLSAVNSSQRAAWKKLGTRNHVDAERRFKRLRKSS